MPSDDHDDRIAEMFARLTARLEDAAALAAEGQQAGTAPLARRALALEIGALVRTAGKDLRQILARLEV